jgi:sterol desaturase/sphingolipid hydroxylase (fatty acid hydroxylase superfamily)
MVSDLEGLLAWKGAAVLAWLGVLFLAERWRPAATPPPAAGNLRGGWHRLARNLGLWLVVTALSPLVVLPLTYWASGQALSWRPAWWQGGLGLALDILLLDFLIYWWHLANHRLPLLWRFHEVHHLDRFLDTTSALRFHFGEVLLSALARAGIIILLGFPFASVLVFEALVLAAAVFHHSNLRLPAGLERPLSRVIITPSIHWVHHHARRADTDSNYGTIFSFWDPLFGTRSPTVRRREMTIGTEGRAEEPLAGLLLHPFRRTAPARPDGRATGKS